MEQVKEFAVKYFKLIAIVLSFVLTLYIEHQNNTREIAGLHKRCEVLEDRLQEQYDRIDAIKLDKVVFEATITQFNSIREDLHEIREDLRALLEHTPNCGTN